MILACGPTSLIYSPPLRPSRDSALYSTWGVYVLFPRDIRPDCFFSLESSFAAIRTPETGGLEVQCQAQLLRSLKPARDGDTI